MTIRSTVRKSLVDHIEHGIGSADGKIMIGVESADGSASSMAAF